MASSLKTLIRTDKPPIVFVSYSHKDEPWKEALLPQLRTLEKLGTLEVWNDRDIKAGIDWYAEIRDVLCRTKVAICLISSNFLSSPFCLDEEVAYLLQARNRGDLEIMPVLVEDCVWQPHRWLKRLQMFPRDGQSVTTHFRDNPARIFSDVASQTYEMLQPGYAFERPSPPGKPPQKLDIDRLPQTGDLLFGRRDEMDALDRIWNDNTLNVAVFKASGGVGKSSLVRAWVEDMALDNYRGAERVFAWSFYSQGTQERVTSADEFISHALGWFGDETRGEGKSPWDRGQLLADLIRQKRTLLLLDGLEPLQSGQAFDRGKIKDPGLEVLLDELGRNNPGLCLISSREEVSDLWHDRQTCRTDQFDLDTISTTAGRALLRVSGIEGEDTALEQAVRDFGQHAYAVKLLGSFLTWCGTPHIDHAANIPDLPDVEESEGKHPRRVMAAFADRFGDSAKSDILAMLGLFDRSADGDCIAALRKEPAVRGLNAAVLSISEAMWQENIADLRKLGLLTPRSHSAPDELDAHPLVRQHCGAQLRNKNEKAWKAGHERLYEHLQTVPEKRQPDTLAEMAPLFQAVQHGCLAGRRQETLDHIYDERINRSNDLYLTRRLGAFGAELGLVAYFFEKPFEQPAADLAETDRAWALIAAGYDIRSLGRISEAVAPTRAAMVMQVEQARWVHAAISADHLCELQLALGNIADAITTGKIAVDLADRSGNRFRRITNRTALAAAQHQSGELDKARKLFKEAETIKNESNNDYPILYAARGYRYCDLLLTLGESEKANEQIVFALKHVRQSSESKYSDLFSIAFNHLTLGRTAMAVGQGDEAHTQLNKAVDALRDAGAINHLPLGLLARAAFFREADQQEKAFRDLEEAMRIVKRGEMLLDQSDTHLEYARLEIKQGNPDAARDHLKSAASLISECGYHRRDGEVADLKKELGL